MVLLVGVSQHWLWQWIAEEDVKVMTTMAVAEASRGGMVLMERHH